MAFLLLINLRLAKRTSLVVELLCRAHSLQMEVQSSTVSFHWLKTFEAIIASWEKLDTLLPNLDN